MIGIVLYSILFYLLYATVLKNYINDNGPFSTILGYSQGAAMAVVYISQENHNFTKMLLFNGYLLLYVAIIFEK